MGINNPSYFPKGDESWKQVFGVDKKDCELYPYTDVKVIYSLSFTLIELTQKLRAKRYNNLVT